MMDDGGWPRVSPPHSAPAAAACTHQVPQRPRLALEQFQRLPVAPCAAEAHHLHRHLLRRPVRPCRRRAVGRPRPAPPQLLRQRVRPPRGPAHRRPRLALRRPGAPAPARPCPAGGPGRPPPAARREPARARRAMPGRARPAAPHRDTPTSRQVLGVGLRGKDRHRRQGEVRHQVADDGLLSRSTRWSTSRGRRASRSSSASSSGRRDLRDLGPPLALAPVWDEMARFGRVETGGAGGARGLRSGGEPGLRTRTPPEAPLTRRIPPPLPICRPHSPPVSTLPKHPVGPGRVLEIVGDDEQHCGACRSGGAPTTLQPMRLPVPSSTPIWWAQKR